MLFPKLHGHRIELTTISEDGLNDMHEYSIKPEFFKYLEYDSFTQIEETKNYLQGLIERSKQDDCQFWFIKLKINNKIIGTIGATNIDYVRKSVEIGYGISPNYWNQGFFKETLNVILDYFFNNQDFHKIHAKTQSDNLSSINGLKKLGFKEEGILRDFYLSRDGKRHNATIFGILKTEFIPTEQNIQSIITLMIKMNTIKNKIRKKCQKIKLVASDVDGVLTDGAMYYSIKGELLKKFYTRDGMAVELLLQNNISTVLITKESSNIVRSRAKKIRATAFLGINNKEQELQKICKKFKVIPEEIAYIGDDVNDISLLKLVGFSASPNNAIEEVKEIVNYVCKSNGGKGVFREIADLIISSNKTYQVFII